MFDAVVDEIVGRLTLKNAPPRQPKLLERFESNERDAKLSVRVSHDTAARIVCVCGRGRVSHRAARTFDAP